MTRTLAQLKRAPRRIETILGCALWFSRACGFWATYMLSGLLGAGPKFRRAPLSSRCASAPWRCRFSRCVSGLGIASLRWEKSLRKPPHSVSLRASAPWRACIFCCRTRKRVRTVESTPELSAADVRAGKRRLSGGIGARGAETGGGAVAAAANRGRTMYARNVAGVHKKSQRLSPLARMLNVSLAYFSGPSAAGLQSGLMIVSVPRTSFSP